jgi:hypothetical protein
VETLVVGWFRGDLAGLGGLEETLLVGWFRGDLAGLGGLVEALLAQQFIGDLAGLGIIEEASLVWVACVEALLAVQTLAGLLGATALAAHVVWNVADRRHLSDILVIPGSLALM